MLRPLGGQVIADDIDVILVQKRVQWEEHATSGVVGADPRGCLITFSLRVR